MEIFWIDDLLAVATRPRGGDWLRDDLADAQLRGVTCVVSCLTREEESELGLNNESDDARSVGLEFIRVPIPDQGTPQPGVVEEALLQIGALAVSQGKIAIHCRQGLGRSPLVAAAMLVRSGMTGVGRLGGDRSGSRATGPGDRGAEIVADPFRRKPSRTVSDKIVVNLVRHSLL